MKEKCSSLPCELFQKPLSPMLLFSSALKVSKCEHEPWCPFLQDPAAQSSVRSERFLFCFSSSEDLSHVMMMISPLHSLGIFSWLSCDGWPGLCGTAGPGKTTPGRRWGQQGHLELYLWSDRWREEPRERAWGGVGLNCGYKKSFKIFINNNYSW